MSTLVVTLFIAYLLCQFLSFFLSKSRTFLFSLHHISLLHLVSTKKTIRQYSLLEVGEFTNRSKKATWRSTKQQNKILRGEWQVISSFGTLNFLQYSNILVYRKFTADSFSEHESRLNHQSAAIAAKFRLFNSFLYLCLIYGGKNFASTIGLFCCEGLSWLRFFTSCSEFPLFCYTGPDEVKHQHKCLHGNKHIYLHIKKSRYD